MGILQDSLVVEAAYLGQSPANSLCRPALHLPFNLVRIDAQADVLKRRIAQDCDLAGVAVDLHIGHMHRRIRRDSYTTKRFAGAAMAMMAASPRTVRWAIAARVMARSGVPWTQKRLRSYTMSCVAASRR